MKNTERAKAIRESLPKQHVYLNQSDGTRLRIFDVKAPKDGSLLVKIIQGGKVAWWTGQPNESITVFAGTPMSETFGAGKVAI